MEALNTLKDNVKMVASLTFHIPLILGEISPSTVTIVMVIISVAG
jgi:hypothetical protein